MRTVFERRSNFIFLAAMGLLLALQLAVLFYYGGKKAGFHEDELYTYYSTNKTAGLFVNDRQWMTRDELRNDFVVLPGEQFRFSVVKQMQSWDVHPPFYYYIFHAACSLFPGVFSKWLGIGVNLIAYVLCFVLLAYGAYTAAGRGRLLAFLTCFSWGFSGAVISGVMFIRMYQWLTLFVLLCMDLHLRAVKKRDFRVGTFLLPVGGTVFFGFLTQYYYVIFHFFLGAGFCLWLLKNKKLRELFSYGAACGLGLLGAVCYYPSSLAHIFRGYRGTEAVSEFGDLSNTWGRLRFFYGLFDDYVMNDTLSLWLLVLCLLAVTAGYLGKRRRGQEGTALFEVPVRLLAFACAGYFFTVAKTALLLGETSNRYQLPVYGILIFLLLYSVWTLSESLIGQAGEAVKDADARRQVREAVKDAVSARAGGRQTRLLAGALLLVLALMNGLALREGKVFFLYEEEREVMEYVRAHSGEPVVVFYHEASPDNVWRLSDELMEYPGVYLASQGNKELIADETVTEAESLLVYVADHDDKEDCLRGLLEANSGLTSYKEAAQKGLWTLYELN